MQAITQTCKNTCKHNYENNYKSPKIDRITTIYFKERYFNAIRISKNKRK
jgi:hypothetical protein